MHQIRGGGISLRAACSYHLEGAHVLSGGANLGYNAAVKMFGTTDVQWMEMIARTIRALHVGPFATGDARQGRPRTEAALPVAP